MIALQILTAAGVFLLVGAVIALAADFWIAAKRSPTTPAQPAEVPA